MRSHEGAGGLLGGTDGLRESHNDECKIDTMIEFDFFEKDS